MASNKSRSGRSTPLRDSSAESTWDALEWTQIEPVSSSRSISYSDLEFLLEAEKVVEEGLGVVLVNTDEAGTLLVTNFRLLFLSEARNIIPLGTIPLMTIERFSKIVGRKESTTRQSDKIPPQRLLQIIGKDMRIIVFGFRPRTKQRRVIFDALLRYTKPARLWDLFALVSGPSKFGNTNNNPQMRLLNEYFRLLGRGFSHASKSMIEDDSYTFCNDLWRISKINSSYAMCQTYPFALIVPKSITDEELQNACSFRAKCRLPVVTWCHPVTGGVLARSSQPLVGLMMNMRSNTDEKLVGALCAQLGGAEGKRRKLYIADARPRKNALANSAMGGGSESSANYSQSEVVFFGIDNIHAMRDSFARLRDYLDTHGSNSSDGISSFLRHGGSTWAGLSSMSASVSTLGDSGWLNHIQTILAGSAWIAGRVAIESASVLVHCSDGWDRTTQLISLASLLLDPYYRTFTGFQALVEKDWLAFGHPFSDRVGLPAVSGGGNIPYELSRQFSAGVFPPSPMHQPSGPHTSQNPSSSHAQTSNNYYPIFMQWIDCVSQLLRMYPFAFEFSSVFLVDLVDGLLSCRFGNFLCNSERERQQCAIAEASGCLWLYMADLRAVEGSSHVHYNLFYDPLKHNGVILPPAAALAPILWPQFHLRWSCPAEAQASEVEAKCRKMAFKFSELHQAKEVAENKAKEISSTVESLSTELRNEKHASRSALNMAKRATKESDAIKRAIQSLGCKVHFSRSGDCTVDIENSLIDTSQRFSYSPSKRQSESMLNSDEKSDLSVSITVVSDEVDPGNPIGRVCEALCPLRTREGSCKWPDAGCAQLGSQFVGLKANFDAFDRLSIYDGYFEPK